MVPRIIRLPNGHTTASNRISRIRIRPDRAESPERPYLEIYEAGRMVFAGVMTLPGAASLSSTAAGEDAA
ncbi:MAG TPA: hypothetical protein VD995_04795 [Azospirillum sp.]|nr:hypothetical protein [Azospirillum sp.]